MENITATAIAMEKYAQRNSVGIDFERVYAEDIRRRQVALERLYRDQQQMLSRIGPMPFSLPVSGSHKRNKRLLLCHS